MKVSDNPSVDGPRPLCKVAGCPSAREVEMRGLTLCFNETDWFCEIHAEQGVEQGWLESLEDE